jgi:hypothetical protein
MCCPWAVACRDTSYTPQHLQHLPQVMPFHQQIQVMTTVTWNILGAYLRLLKLSLCLDHCTLVLHHQSSWPANPRTMQLNMIAYLRRCGASSTLLVHHLARQESVCTHSSSISRSICHGNSPLMVDPSCCAHTHVKTRILTNMDFASHAEVCFLT